MKEEKFQNSRKPSHRWVCGEYWSLRGQNQGGKTHTHTHTHTHTQNRCLTATASGEVAQRLLFATSKQGLDREAQSASSVLRVMTGPECPEDNLKELT